MALWARVGKTGRMGGAETSVATAGPTLRLLCVEDNEELAAYLHLEFDGEVVVPGRPTQVTLAEDLAGARRALSTETFDLVLLDLTLPDSEGLDTILGVVDAAGAAAVVVITGITDVEFGERALLAGAHDFMIKGRYTSADLRRSVRFAVARQRRVLETQAALRDSAGLHASAGARLAPGGEAAGVAPRMARRVPLHETFPEQFAEIVDTYRELVPLRVEEQGLRVDYRVSASARVLAGELGRLRARAPDLGAVHVRALEELTAGVSLPRARALAASADSLLLETLGHLLGYYRGQLIGVASGARTQSES